MIVDGSDQTRRLIELTGADRRLPLVTHRPAGSWVPAEGLAALTPSGPGRRPDREDQLGAA